MLPTSFVTPLSETLWDPSADYLLVFNVEFLYPDNLIFTVTKVRSFLHYSHLDSCISVGAFAGYTLCIILFIYGIPSSEFF